ncbi:UNVERIFIED_CONTAM: hypothetical protein FKN15_037902 [Acipenser sinensis]
MARKRLSAEAVANLLMESGSESDDYGQMTLAVNMIQLTLLPVRRPTVARKRSLWKLGLRPCMNPVHHVGLGRGVVDLSYYTTGHPLTSPSPKYPLFLAHHVQG